MLRMLFHLPAFLQICGVEQKNKKKRTFSTQVRKTPLFSLISPALLFPNTPLRAHDVMVKACTREQENLSWTSNLFNKNDCAQLFLPPKEGTHPNITKKASGILKASGRLQNINIFLSKEKKPHTHKQ